MSHTDPSVNPALLSLSMQAVNQYVEKTAFIPPEDPSMGGGGGMPPGGGGMPPGGDPMAGGMPPGGAPPMDPAMMGGAGAMPPAAPPAPAPAPAPGAEPIKPKIDVNVEIMQMKNMLAKLLDSMGVQIPAQDMVATPEKLNEMAAGGDPATGGAGGADPSAIPPIDPMAAAMPQKAGGDTYRPDGESTVDTHGLGEAGNLASAILSIQAA